MPTISFLPLTSKLVSTDTGSSVRFSVTNNTAEKLLVYWIDRSGNEVLYGELAPNMQYNQETSASHAWMVRSVDGQTGFKFLPSAPGAISVTNINAPTFKDYSENIIQTPEGLWSTAQGYGLIDASKSLGIANTVDLPMNGQNNNAALNAMNAPDAWAAGYTGKGVKVAIIDIGIAANVEINGRIVGGHDFFDGDTTPAPDNGNYKDHALGAASIIAASHAFQSGPDTKGVAPDAQLLNVRVGSNATGSSESNISQGIRWAADNGAKVVCMPLQNSANGVSQQLIDAVHYAYLKGVVVVIIGGNYSSYGATGPAMIAQQLPGEVIDVGNFNLLTGSAFASSNMPAGTPFPWVMASSSGYVPNSAGGYTSYQDGGTSFAGPYVAGLAALLFEQNPNATASEIIKKIIAGANIGNNAGAADLAITAPVVKPPVDPYIIPAPITIIKEVIKEVIVEVVKEVYVQPVNSVVAGTAAIDTKAIAGLSGDYNVVNTPGVTILTNTKDNTITTMTSIERVSFSDKTIALDVSGGSGEVYRLYQAAFGRTPDKGGLGYWIEARDDGMALASVANGFTSSAEFKALYGAQPTATQLVTAMYQNVLHRAPDAAGLNYWVEALNQGTPVDTLLMAFSESVENIAAVAKIIGQGFEYEPFPGA